ALLFTAAVRVINRQHARVRLLRARTLTAEHDEHVQAIDRAQSCFALALTSLGFGFGLGPEASPDHVAQTTQGIRDRLGSHHPLSFACSAATSSNRRLR